MSLPPSHVENDSGLTIGNEDKYHELSESGGKREKKKYATTTHPPRSCQNCRDTTRNASNTDGMTGIWIRGNSSRLTFGKPVSPEAIIFGEQARCWHGEQGR